MNRRHQEKRILELRQNIERILTSYDIGLDLGPSGKHEKSIRNRHTMLYVFILLEALAKAIDRQPTITAEDLEAVEGVGPATAERIVDHLT